MNNFKSKVLTIFCLLFSIVLFTFSALASDSTDVIQKVGHGQINWTEKVVVATGTGAPDLKAPNVSVARIGAERAAKLDALRNILEALKGVKITANASIADRMGQSNDISAQVQGMARNFKVVDTRYYSDGGVDVVVQMEITSQLRALLFPKNKKKEKKVVKKEGEKLKTKYTSLIVIASKLGLVPAMAPKILNQKGKKIYGAEMVEPSILESKGVSTYCKTLKIAKKRKITGKKPLIIKAVKLADGSKSDLVIKGEDAKKLEAIDLDTTFLKEAKVIFVTN